jgi:cytochrome c553
MLFATPDAPGGTCRPANKMQSRGKDNMKKIIVLAAILAATVGLRASAADAKENYDTLCSKCHGADGKGDTKMGKKYGAKDYTDAKVQADLKDDAAIKAIKEGYKDKDGKEVMKAAEGLSDSDIKALVAYLRAFKK